MHPWLVTQEPGGVGPQHLVGGRLAGMAVGGTHAVQSTHQGLNRRQVSIIASGIGFKYLLILVPFLHQVMFIVSGK